MGDMTHTFETILFEIDGPVATVTMNRPDAANAQNSTLDAHEAWRLGLVNRVVPRDELEARTRELAERVALVPPVTAQTVKDTINQTATLMGKRDALKYHFMAHHWVHNTATALDALAARKAKGSMKEIIAEREQGRRQPGA